MNGFFPIRRFVVAGLLALSMLAQADEPVVRPRIGLVLGGGGARGAAHVGVLEVLDKLRVPVDCVAGTSMGALVAGAFAAGLSPDEMREELARADWNDMFHDNPEYAEVSYRNTAISRRYLPGSEMGVSSKGVSYQGGVVAGEKIKLFFNRLVDSDLGERHIEMLPLPLSIVATDIGNGDKVVFRDGSLTKAMRASMSVPGIMSPVDYRGLKLVDGGLVDNLPVDEVRDRCHPDVVIAVNVGSPLLKPEEVGSLLTVSVQMVAILTEQNVTRSLALLKPGDVLIKPDLAGITAGDFERNAESADRGRAAAEAVADRLQAYSLSEADYAAWRKPIAFAREATPRIDEIRIAKLKTVNPAAVERQLSVKPGDAMDAQRINEDMLRIYGDGWYESVDYALLRENDRNVLQVTPVEKPWGPDYLRFGLSLDSNLKQSSSYTLRAAYDKTWINQLGGQLIFGAEIGRKNTLGVELYQPLEARQRYFLESSLSYGLENQGIYQDDRKLADYEKNQGIATLGAGVNLGPLGQLHGGWKQVWLDAKLDTGIPSSVFPERLKRTYGGQYVALDVDRMDRLYFPTAGWSSKVAYFNSAKEGYSRLNAEFDSAWSLGDYVVNGKISYQGSLRGRLPIYDAGNLGGFNNLSAFAANQINGDHVRYASLRAERILGRAPLGLRGDMRIGVALEAGKFGQLYTETKRVGWLNSATIYLGGETGIGPVYVGYGRSDSGSSNVYLFVGTP